MDVIVEMVTEECCACGVLFGMTKELNRRRMEDHKNFYCPMGHSQHYTGKTEAQKLKEELARKQQQLDSAQCRAAAAERRRENDRRKYDRMRDRVKNGVCPCCNRSFPALASHMRTQHPDFATEKQLKTMRLLYGLTQCELADEVGISQGLISRIERGLKVSDDAMGLVNTWLETA